jgi:hypothetical protein
LGPGGTFYEAAAFNNGLAPISVVAGSQTFTFMGDGSTASTLLFGGISGGALGAYTTGDTNLDNALSNFAFPFGGGLESIQLKNLVPGQTYYVQLFAWDNRSAPAQARRVNFQDPNNAADVTKTYTEGSLSYVVGTFVATGTTQNIQQNQLDTSANVNAVVVGTLNASVSSDAGVSFLELSPAGTLTPTFGSGTTNYTANEANANSSVSVLVTNTSAYATNVLFLNGVAQATNAGALTVASLPLVVGSANEIQVQVTAQDGLTVSNYYVTVTRAASSNAGLTSLALTPAGTLYPTFATGTLSYNATNTCNNNPLTVTVTNADVTATNTLYLNGVSQGALTNGVASAPLVLGAGSNNVTVQVVSQDLTATNDYVTAVTLSAPPTVSVNSTNIYAGGTATLTATTSASSPSYLWSPGSATTASITVSPTTNTTYTVTVTDGATLCVGGGSGTVTILPSTNTYVNNPVTVAAGSVDANATLQFNFNGGGYGAAVTNNLSIGGNTLVLPANTVAVRVVSQDLSQTNTYTVNVLLEPSQSVPKLTNSVSGNNLVLAWPADHLGYRLLVQTGNLNKGVSGNINDWTTVAGSQSITATNLTIIKGGVTNEYYRLVYP